MTGRIGIRSILHPERGVVALPEHHEVVVEFGGVTLTIAASGDAVEITTDRGGLVVLPRAVNRLLVQQRPRDGRSSG